MANEAAYLWFVPSVGNDTHAILIKSPTGAIKAVIKDSKVEFAFGLIELEGKHLAIATRIHDDPVAPLIVLKVQRVKEEHDALSGILHREETPIFFFDELCRCVAGGHCRFQAVKRLEALKLISEFDNLYVGKFDKVCNVALDCFQLTLDPSVHIQGAKPIPFVLISGNVQNLRGIFISAIGVRFCLHL
ncbi:MAG: hypothetical protein ABR577_11640 [Pyrinomonadaceae bacterium]